VKRKFREFKQLRKALPTVFPDFNFASVRGLKGKKATADNVSEVVKELNRFLALLVNNNLYCDETNKFFSPAIIEYRRVNPFLISSL